MDGDIAEIVTSGSDQGHFNGGGPARAFRGIHRRHMVVLRLKRLRFAVQTEIGAGEADGLGLAVSGGHSDVHPTRRVLAPRDDLVAVSEVMRVVALVGNTTKRSRIPDRDGPPAVGDGERAYGRHGLRRRRMIIGRGSCGRCDAHGGHGHRRGCQRHCPAPDAASHHGVIGGHRIIGHHPAASHHSVVEHRQTVRHHGTVSHYGVIGSYRAIRQHRAIRHHRTVGQHGTVGRHDRRARHRTDRMRPTLRCRRLRGPGRT